MALRRRAHERPLVGGGPVFRRLFLVAFATAVGVGLLIGIVWVIAGIQRPRPWSVQSQGAIRFDQDAEIVGWRRSGRKIDGLQVDAATNDAFDAQKLPRVVRPARWKKLGGARVHVIDEDECAGLVEQKQLYKTGFGYRFITDSKNGVFLVREPALVGRV